MEQFPAAQNGQDTAAKAPLTVKAFVGDEDSAAVVRQSLSDLGVEGAEIVVGKVLRSAEILLKEKSPQLLVVDVSNLDDPVASMVKLADVCDPHTQVVAIGETNDIRLYREMRRVGVAEYFYKPLVRAPLTRTFGALLMPQADPSRLRTAKLIFVLSVRGGGGATTIATMLAWELAETLRRHTLLLDLDLLRGDAALQLGSSPTHALREALDRPERVDKLYQARAVKPATERLDVLAALEPLSDPVTLSEPSVLSLLAKLLSYYRFLIVDLPAEVAVGLKAVLSLPSTCLLVSNASLASARDVARWREFIGPNTPDRVSLHIVNRTKANGGLTAAEFEKASGGPPDLLIPYDREISGATDLGISAMRNCSVFKKALEPMIGNLTGEQVIKPRSMFSKVFG